VSLADPFVCATCADAFHGAEAIRAIVNTTPAIIAIERFAR
jgi:hypothetical protein